MKPFDYYWLVSMLLFGMGAPRPVRIILAVMTFGVALISLAVK